MLRWLPAVLLGWLVVPLASLYAYDDYDAIHSYVSGGLHHWSSEDSSAQGLKIRFGQQLNAFVGAEMHFAIGGEDPDTETSLDRLFGLYAKFILPLDSFSPYVKLGGTSASLSTAGESSSDFEMSYGLGAEFNITDRFFVDLEYMVYLETATLELEGFTLGIGYRLP
ncbi:outer membrane beta-barrel protein [Marinospirillum alkaliphilum]|uniref:Opacity protein n=1 Tax=Marinospirillum alkaliphilum DSM 21637 TaxID=1122209 RepID=A0A1K1VGE1_9GAMM|nr:outer membrane beta-barrel protein [Marinospirillum alkaliphilum]SFX24217.1 Opacity protein [Marinospirillum alkaliphilum DSM 21637]